MRARSLFAPLLALLAVAGAAPAESGAAATASIDRSEGTRPVVSPRPGQVVRGEQVVLRVRSRTLDDTLRVRLNGMRIGGDFGLPRGGVRTLRASASHGLRRGANVLRVTVRRVGGATRTARIRFTVRTGDPLVGAGRDRPLAVGGKVRIAGDVSRALRNAPDKLRWEVVRAPRVSPGHAALLRGARPHALTSPAGETAGFRPRVPGSYTLRLEASAGSETASDMLTLRASPRSKLVHIETMTDTELPWKAGIRVGGITYLLKDARGFEGAFLQVLVLKRRTLEFVSNQKLAAKESTIAAELAKLDASNLVIAVLQKPTGAGRYNIAAALAPIGFPEYAGPQTGDPGTVSAIGVPGMNRGDADVNILPNGSGRVAPMKGYLTPDQYGNFGFVPTERLPFDFTPEPSDPCTQACDDRVGFRIRNLDSRTLAPGGWDGEIYSTNGRNLDLAGKQREMERMAGDLAAIPPENVVMIETVSDRRPGEAGYRPPIADGIPVAVMTRLANEIPYVGGTRNAFNRIARLSGSPATGGLTYALVGWKFAGEGNGSEVAAGVDGDEPSLTGVLRPDRQSRFRPTALDSAPEALANLILAEPTTRWPLEEDPGAMSALSWLGSTNPQLGSDPRAAYALQPFGKSDWLEIARQIENVEYAKVPDARRADFTEAQFLAARDRLVQELRWVANVRSYLAKLKSPIADSEVLSYADVQRIADTVYEQSHKPEGEGAMRWVELVEIALEILGPATHELSSAVAHVIELGVWAFSADEKGNPAEEMRFKADELGAKLIQEMQDAKKSFDAMGDVIVSDPVKLEFVGSHGDCIRTDATCPEGYSFSADDKRHLSADFARTIERAAYEELLPLGFHVFALNIERLGPKPPDPRWYNCGAYPWWYYSDLAIARATYPLLLRFDPVDPTLHWWQILVLSTPRSSAWGTPPSDATLKRLFDAVPDSDNPRDGGLGISPFRLMSTAKWYVWHPTRNSPNRDDCS